MTISVFKKELLEVVQNTHADERSERCIKIDEVISQERTTDKREIQRFLDHMSNAVKLTRQVSYELEEYFNEIYLLEELLTDAIVIYTPGYSLYPRRTINDTVERLQEKVGAPEGVTLQ